MQTFDFQYYNRYNARIVVTGDGSGGGGSGEPAWLLQSGGQLTGPNIIKGSAANFIKFQFDGLGSTQVDGAGLWLANTTAAVGGVDQISPSVVWGGNAFDNNSEASIPVKFSTDVVPDYVSGIQGTWRLRASINNLPYDDAIRYTVDDNGNNTLILGSDLDGAKVITQGSNSGLDIGTFNANDVVFLTNNIGKGRIFGDTGDWLIGLGSSDNARLYVRQAALSSNHLQAFRVDPGQHTSIPAGQGYTAYQFSGNTLTWLTPSTVASMKLGQFRAFTLSGNPGNTATFTDVYTVYIEPSTLGTDAVITNNYALGLGGQLGLISVPSNDDALTQILARDATTGIVKYRTSSSIAPPAWLLASGGTLTGSNTITSNTENQLNFGGTWSATGDLKYHANFSGTLTSQAGGSNQTIYGYKFTPTLLVGGGASGLTSNGIYLAPTLTNGTNLFGVHIDATLSGAITASELLRVSSTGTRRFSIGSNGAATFSGSGGSAFQNGDLVVSGGGKIQVSSGAAAELWLSGSGATYKFQVGSNFALNDSTSNVITVSNSSVTITQRALSSGWGAALTSASGAHTSLTAATEFISRSFQGATQTWTAGGSWTGIPQRFNYFQAYTMSAASATTVPDAYGVFIEAPLQSGSLTITNKWALGTTGSAWLQGANSRVLLGAGNVGIREESGVGIRIGSIAGGGGGWAVRFVDAGDTQVTALFGGNVGGVANTASFAFNSTTLTNATFYINQSGLANNQKPVLRTDAGAHTSLTANTEFISVDFQGASQQWLVGTVTDQRFNYFRAYTVTGASATATFTNAYTVYIDSTVAGANAAITRNWSLGTGGDILAKGFIFQGNLAGDYNRIVNSAGFVGYEAYSATTRRAYMLYNANEFTITTQVANTSLRLATLNGGVINITQGAMTTGWGGTTLTAGAHTGMTASTEFSGSIFSIAAVTQQWATGALTTQRFVRFGAPTISFVGASTATDVYNVYIDTPIAGTNATITNVWALGVSGQVSVNASQFANALSVSGSSSLGNSPLLRLNRTGTLASSSTAGWLVDGSNGIQASASITLYQTRISHTLTTGATDQILIGLANTSSYVSNNTGTSVVNNYFAPSISGSQLASIIVKAWYHNTGFIQWDSVLSPSQITGNQNDYDPSGWTSTSAPYGASITRLSTDASRDITGWAGGFSGRIVIRSNVGSFPIVLKHDVTSTAANRYTLAGSTDLTIPAGASWMEYYDGATQRWRVVSVTQTALSSLSVAIANNDINNGANVQTWRWNTITSGGLLLSADATTSTNGSILLSASRTGAHSSSGVQSTALVVSNTHTGTSSQNQGIVIGVSGGATSNVAIRVDAGDLQFDTSTGSKIGTNASQKIGFWGATAIIQPSGTGETVGFTAGGGTTVTDASTFTGNVGSKAYRISDVVKALKNAGIMAAS